MRLCGAAVGWLSVAMQQSGGQIDYAVWSPDSQKSSLIHWNANVTDASSDNILNGAVNTKHLLSEYVQPRSDLNGNISVAGSRLFHRNVLNLFRPSRMDISWGGESAFFFFSLETVSSDRFKNFNDAFISFQSHLQFSIKTGTTSPL